MEVEFWFGQNLIRQFNLDFSLGRESFQWKPIGFRWSRSVGKLAWYSLSHSELQQIVNELIRLSKRESFPNYSDHPQIISVIFPAKKLNLVWFLLSKCRDRLLFYHLCLCGKCKRVKITRHHLITSSNDCPALTIKIVLNPLHNICPPVKHPQWFLLDIISIKWWLALNNNREVDWRWITTGTSELTELPSLLFSVKHQQQRSGRVQPAGSPLGVGRGSDAKAEAGGEGLVRPGTATVQLPATVRLKCVCVCVTGLIWCVWCLFLSV